MTVAELKGEIDALAARVAALEYAHNVLTETEIAFNKTVPASKGPMSMEDYDNLAGP